MTTDFAWIDEYYNWLRGNASAKQLQNGWTEIGTPFMDRHNDGLIIYAKLENDRITLSDDGYIIGDLLADGVMLSGKKRKELLENFLLSYGVQNINNELIMHTTVEDYPVSMHMFLQAMLSINDMFMLNNASVKGIFLDDVASFLDEQQVIYTPSFIAKGSTGLEFNFHFQIAGKQSEILINTFNKINKGNISSFLFDWLDIKEARQRRARKTVTGLAFINDDGGVDGKFLEALKAKNTDYILFSERNNPENIRKLKAA